MSLSEPSETRVIKLQDHETVRFLELYSGERLLYDPNCKYYKHRDLRMEAAKRISDALGIPGFGAKAAIAKFKNLRSSYCQELKKIADSERTASGPDDVYVPKVIWFETMNNFIRPFVTQRPTNSLMSTNPCSPLSHEDTSQQGSNLEPICEITPTVELYQTEEAINGHVGDAADDTPLSRLKRKVEPSAKMKRMRLDSHVPYYDETSYSAPHTAKEDSYDFFGKYVGSMLRDIGPPQSYSLQEKITRLLTRAICPPRSPSNSYDD